MATRACRLKNFKTYTFRQISRPRDALIPNDTEEFIYLFLNHEWNELIYSKIFRFLGFKPNKLIIENKKECFDGNKIKEKIKYLLKKIICWFKNRHKNNQSVFMIDDYLDANLKNTIYPNALTFVFPKINFFRLKPVGARKCLNYEKKEKTFKHFIYKNIITYIPKIFLENFQIAKEKIDKLNYLPNPKIIFTSNAYLYNDMFKIYAASKCENGTKLILGQHGGFYGLARIGGSSEFEERICDKFLTWGWKSKKKLTVPIGYFGKFKEVKYNKSKKDILLIQSALSTYTYLSISSMLNSDDSDQYTYDQIKFISGLTTKIQTRLHLKGLNPSKSIQNKYVTLFPKIKFVQKRVQKIVRNYRLAVVSYNGTPVNELLLINFPTIIFWDRKMWELTTEAQSVINTLKTNKIFFHDPEEAASQVCRIYNNIPSWWFSSSVQKARIHFLQKYANQNKEIIKNLSKVLK